jgi:hypothetical protein
MAIDGKITNEELLMAITELKAENNQENQMKYIDKVLRAKFLVPAQLDPKPERDADGKLITQGQIRVNFKLISNKSKANFIPCFTDDDSFNAGVKEHAERLVLNYKQLAPVILSSKGAIQGFVINPYTDGMLIPAPMIAKMEEASKKAEEAKKAQKAAPKSVVKQEIPENTKIKLRTPKYMPVDMINEATEYFKNIEDVNAAYVQLMEKGDSDEEFLVTVDYDGDEEKLFEQLMPILRKNSFDMPVSLTGVNNGLGQKVKECAEPFYVKETQEEE